MRFSMLIFKNILRRKTRSAFTVLGISIGIATVIALGAVMNGMTISMEGMLKSGKADFSIAQSGISDFAFSRVNENRTNEIQELEGVKDATGILLGFYPIANNPYVIAWGVETEDFPLLGMNIISGSSFSQEHELLIGEIASKEWNKTVDNTLTIRDQEFTITGVFQTGSMYQDKGVTLSLNKLQQIQNQEGYVTVIYVELEEGANAEEICQQIEQNYPDLVTIKSISELSKVDKGLETLDAATIVISLLAIIIGGIGVTNTIMMSVYERTREIGVLRAVGWTKKRILTMVLGESILLCLFSVLIGSLLGVIGTQLLTLQPIIRGLLTPMYALDTFLRAIIVAFSVGLVGGLYPAYRATKLSPSEALRYE